EFPGFIDESEAIAGADQRQSLGERVGDLELRIDRHFSGAVDIAPMAGDLDRRETFGKASGFVELRLNRQLSGMADIAVFTIHRKGKKGVAGSAPGKYSGRRNQRQ